ncbi:MAG: hypothetical protein RIB78_03010 [Gammaproteobacteria bacterium]
MKVAIKASDADPRACQYLPFQLLPRISFVYPEVFDPACLSMTCNVIIGTVAPGFDAAV